jgi:hypothetical protein
MITKSRRSRRIGRVGRRLRSSDGRPPPGARLTGGRRLPRDRRPARPAAAADSRATGGRRLPRDQAPQPPRARGGQPPQGAPREKRPGAAAPRARGGLRTRGANWHVMLVTSTGAVDHRVARRADDRFSQKPTNTARQAYSAICALLGQLTTCCDSTRKLNQFLPFGLTLSCSRPTVTVRNHL